jgi:hypothetical protein
MASSEPVSAKDVKTAWTGVHIPAPTPPDAPSDVYALVFLAKVLAFLLSLPTLIFVALWLENPAWVSPVAIAIFVYLAITIPILRLAFLSDRRRIATSLRQYSSALERYEAALATAPKERVLQTESLIRGYAFIGAHYHSWLTSGTALIQADMIARLGLSRADVVAAEAVPDVMPPEPAPITPQLNSDGGAAYPLAKQVHYTCYLVTPSMLVVSPTDACRMSSAQQGFLGTLSDAFASLRVSPLAVDIEATSIAAVAMGEIAPRIVVPDSVTSQELFFQEMINIAYTTAEANSKSAVVVTMRDGRRIEVPGTERIADLVRRRLREYKSQSTTEGGVAASLQGDGGASSIASGNTKACPMCAEAIKVAAKICRYCGHKFDVQV